jgi:hypothetical protein
LTTDPLTQEAHFAQSNVPCPLSELGSGRRETVIDRQPKGDTAMFAVSGDRMVDWAAAKVLFLQKEIPAATTSDQ